MSEELSIVKEETTENKIVPLVNTTTSDEAENKSEEPVAESSAPNTAAAPEASDTHQSAASQPESNRSVSGSNASQNDSKYSSDDFDFDEDEKPKKRFFHFHSKDDGFSRDQLILSRIKDEDLMDYLKLEQERLEFLQQAKEVKEKRILTAFQLTVSLAAIVAVTYLLKDNPTILISILYIVGIIAAINIWKNPRDKGKDKE